MVQHFHSLTALRGAACVLVILAHVQPWDAAFGASTPGFREVRWVGWGTIDVFFVLSGFIIATTNRKNLGRPAAVPGYFARRAWRVYPTYWAATALAVLSAWALFGVTPGGAQSIGRWPVWLALVPAADVNPYVGQAWTLPYEVVFYAGFGLVLALPPRGAAAVLGAWGLVVAAALAAPVSENPWLAVPLSPFVAEFLGGCGVAWLAGRGVRGWPGAALVAGVVWAAVGAVLVARGPVEYEFALSRQPLRVLVFGPAAVLIVYAAVAAEGRWPRRVPGWLLSCGNASYSLYLTHCQVILAAVVVGLKMPHTRFAHLLWLAGTVAAIFVVGFTFYVLVERPLLNLGRTKRKPEPAPASPVAAPARRAA